MAELAVTVNGRSHILTCDDGQEARLRGLAQYLDARVAGFVTRIGQVGEARLLLLAALAIADELSDAREALRREQTRSDAVLEAAAGGVLGLAERVEAIAARLETA